MNFCLSLGNFMCQGRRTQKKQDHCTLPKNKDNFGSKRIEAYKETQHLI